MEHDVQQVRQSDLRVIQGWRVGNCRCVSRRLVNQTGLGIVAGCGQYRAVSSQNGDFDDARQRPNVLPATAGMYGLDTPVRWVNIFSFLPAFVCFNSTNRATAESRSRTIATGSAAIRGEPSGRSTRFRGQDQKYNLADLERIAEIVKPRQLWQISEAERQRSAALSTQCGLKCHQPDRSQQPQTPPNRSM